MNDRPSPLPLLLVGVAAAVLDLVSKSWVFGSIPLHGSREVIPDWFLIAPHFNPHGPWSIGRSVGATILRFALPILSLVAVAVLVRILARSDARDRTRGVGFALILGGAVGNLWDRAFTLFDPSFGGVRDFLLVRRVWFGNDFPAFNLADTWITVGVILVAWRILREEAGPEAGKKEAGKKEAEGGTRSVAAEEAAA